MTRTPPADPERLAAEVYDHLVPDWPAEMDFYRRLAASASNILEIACGTGRISLRLASEGRSVHGFDLSPAMLDIARQKSRGNPNLILSLADMRSFDLGEAFDLILIPAHSFQFMLSIDDQLSCLRSVRSHLRPDGRFVLHLDHQDVQWLARISARTDPSFDPPAQVVLPDGRRFGVSKRWSYDAASQTASAVTAFDELNADGGRLARTERGPVSLHCFFPVEVEHLLRRAGFAIEAVHGDFLSSALTSQSTEMIWLARPEAHSPSMP